MGALMMALGGFLAVSDKRYRLAVNRKAARRAICVLGADWR